MPDTIMIRNLAERTFAEIFFGHDQWVHHPSPIILEAGPYQADFYDFKSETYIEVVNSPVAFTRNLEKYEECLEKGFSLEFYRPNGERIDASSGLRSVHIDSAMIKPRCRDRKNRNLSEIYFELAAFFIDTNMSGAKFSRIVGFDHGTAMRFAHNSWAMVSEVQFQRVVDLLAAWRKEPERFRGVVKRPNAFRSMLLSGNGK